MIKRAIEERVLYFSKKYPVITITGPRQSGKTTLVKSLFPEHVYYSLENPSIRAQVIEDPSLLFEPEGKKIIIDEVQRVPDLLSYIQELADRQKINGQFVVTGSQSLLLGDKISQTLAGRTAVLKLLPFSLAELKSLRKYSKNPYEDWLFRGFYPRLYDQKLNPEDFFPFYFETYLQRDVREMQQIRDLNQFTNFVRLCAGRIGQLLDYSSLANDSGLSVNTVKGWLSLLEASYIIIRLHPYYKNLNKRIIKSPKLYFVDVGLASFLLNIHEANQISTHYLKGNLFENLIILELLKNRFNQARLPNLYFFRDSNKNEVDCVIENAQIRALEIKSSITFSSKFVEGLAYISRSSGIKPNEGVVIYGGDDHFPFQDHSVLSWKNLDYLFPV